jgi:hypothetical protein
MEAILTRIVRLKTMIKAILTSNVVMVQQEEVIAGGSHRSVMARTLPEIDNYNKKKKRRKWCCELVFCHLLSP